MKRLGLTIAALSTIAGLVLPATSLAAAPSMAAPAGLSVLELKVTGDELMVLQNNTGSVIADLSSYWLAAYNNVNPLGAGVSVSSQQLPSVSLAAGQTLLLSANPMPTCGASVAGKLALSLSDSGGFLQLSQSNLAAGGAVNQVPGDYVSWSSGANGAIQNLPSNTKDSRSVFYRYLNGISYAWQPADLDATNGCQLNIVVAGGSGSSSAVTPLTLAATSPPATILGTNQTVAPSAGIPTADGGLTAPQITELLPNPAGTGNDATDEFIELYNPNVTAFDLSGFTMQVGSTTAHNFTFPAGTMLKPSSFTAFYAATTKLSQSNNGGQAALIDPLGRVLSLTDPYGTAKDGYAWALANGHWYWTTQPTPNAANIIKQPVTKSATSKSSSKLKKVVGGTAAASHKTSAAKLSGDQSAAVAATASASSIHVWILALVAAAALLYGAYEYRRDLANRMFQFKSYLTARRTSRSSVAGRRNDRAGE